MRSEMEQFQDLDRIRREFDTTQVTNSRRYIRSSLYLYLSLFFFLLSPLCGTMCSTWHTMRLSRYMFYVSFSLFKYTSHNTTPIIFESYTVQNKLQELKQSYMKRRDTMRQQV